VKIGTRPQVPPEQQPDAALTQANPVQNTWYTVLDTTPNARIIGMACAVLTTGETIEVRMTVDGQVKTGSMALSADTGYYVYLYTGSDASKLYFTSSVIEQYGRSFIIEGRSVKVEIRKTTAAGAGNLWACVSYARW